MQVHGTGIVTRISKFLKINNANTSSKNTKGKTKTDGENSTENQVLFVADKISSEIIKQMTPGNRKGTMIDLRG